MFFRLASLCVLLSCLGLLSGCVKSEAVGTSPQIRAASVISDPAERSRVLIAVAERAMRPRKNKEKQPSPEEALSLAEESASLVDDPAQRVPLLADLGRVYVKLGKQEKAQPIIDEAMAKLEEVKEPVDRIKSSIAIAKMLGGEFKKTDESNEQLTSAYDAIVALKLESPPEDPKELALRKLDVINHKVNSMMSLISASHELEQNELRDKYVVGLADMISSIERADEACRQMSDATMQLGSMGLRKYLPPMLVKYEELIKKIEDDQKTPMPKYQKGELIPHLLDIVDRYISCENAESVQNSIERLEVILEYMTGEARTRLADGIDTLRERMKSIPPK